MKGSSFFALLTGAAAGLCAGFLLAPESGEETRRKIRKVVDEEYDKVKDVTEDWADDLADLTDTVKARGADLKDDAREKILSQLDKLQKALEKKVDEAPFDQDDVPGEEA